MAYIHKVTSLWYDMLPIEDIFVVLKQNPNKNPKRKQPTARVTTLNIPVMKEVIN